MPLTSQQRKALEQLSHPLRPVVNVGKAGLTEAVSVAADEALESHELIKVKFIAFKEERDTLSTQLAESLKAERVARIGNVAILFRQHPDPKKRKYRI
ncbi:YhbY family RNA-binding protein [Candidatus Sumerlaeota bacterium]|nr:YhbY family RNA-binding protein [Candidatus Sumerlaeota bacterium]